MGIDARAIAFRRFGLGARPGDLAKPASDVVGELLGEVSLAIKPAALAALPASTSLYDVVYKLRAQRKTAREAKATGPDAEAMAQQMQAMPGTPRPMEMQAAEALAGAMSDPATMPPPGPHEAKRAAPPVPNPIPEALAAELGARLAAARAAPIGFGERLAMFWANHFTVSGTEQDTHITAGAFEREAIRPHLNGTFHDMLAAVESHPTMIRYLNNERSMGPNSLAGKRQSKGLNENLAREILELHTVGVDGGYTQADVTSFARAITGWSIIGPQGVDGEPGTFFFRPNMHEPGVHTVLGRDYPQEGIEQGRAILADLAREPKSAQHIAFKLVRHFIADDPPAAAVAAVADAFHKSGGNLPAVYTALLQTDAAFSAPPQKLRPPVEFVLASTRALETDIAPQQFHRALVLLGQQPYKAPSPQGWSDDSKAWLAPDAIRTRLEFANLLAQKAGGVQPLDRAKAVLGPLLSEETSTTIERAETTGQALAMLLMSPEFQRR